MSTAPAKTVVAVADRAAGGMAGMGTGAEEGPVPIGGFGRGPVVMAATDVVDGGWLGRFAVRDRARLRDAVVAVAGGGRGLVLGAPGVRAGEFFEVVVAPGPDLGGTGVVVTVVDASERFQRDQRLLFAATHDPLTGLLNRAGLFDRLEQALARRVRHRSLLAVLFVDLCQFKTVNDRFGHCAGDQLLQAVADRARLVVRAEDSVARLGGDEFVVVCESLTTPADAVTVTERLRVAIGQPIPVDGDQLRVAATVGVAFAGPAGEDPDGLVDRADRAMYAARAGVVTGPGPQPGAGHLPGPAATTALGPSARRAAAQLAKTQSELARQWAGAVEQGDTAAAARWQAAYRAVRHALAALDQDTLL